MIWKGRLSENGVREEHRIGRIRNSSKSKSKRKHPVTSSPMPSILPLEIRKPWEETKMRMKSWMSWLTSWIGCSLRWEGEDQLAKLQYLFTVFVTHLFQVPFDPIGVLAWCWISHVWFSKQLPLLVITLQILGTGWNGSPSRESCTICEDEHLWRHIFEDKIVKDSEMSSSGVRKGPKSKNRCPCERRKEGEDAQRGRPCEDRSRDWSYTTIGQRVPVASRN